MRATPNGQHVQVADQPVETATPQQLAAQRRARSRRASARSSSPSRRPNAGLERDPRRPELERSDLRRDPAAAAGVRDHAVRDRPERGHLELTSRSLGRLGSRPQLRVESTTAAGAPARHVASSCTAATGCLAHPVIQEIGALPSGTSAPNTVITEHAMREFHIQASTTDWLVQGTQPFTRVPDQQRRARRVDDAALGRVEERPADLVRRHRLGDDLRDRHRPRRARDVGRARPERDGERPPHARGDRCVAATRGARSPP